MWSLNGNYWWSRAKTRYQNWPKTTQAYFESVEITEGETMMSPPKVQPLSYSPNQKMKLWSSSLYRMTVINVFPCLSGFGQHRSCWGIQALKFSDSMSRFKRFAIRLSKMSSNFVIESVYNGFLKYWIYCPKMSSDDLPFKNTTRSSLKKCFLSSTENYSKC